MRTHRHWRRALTPIVLVLAAAIPATLAATHIGLDAPNIGLNAAKNGQGAVRAGDTMVCAAPGNCRIIAGSTSVLIGN